MPGTDIRESMVVADQPSLARADRPPGGRTMKTRHQTHTRHGSSAKCGPTGKLRDRTVLALCGSLLVLLSPVCELRGGQVVLEGPEVVPEVATAISVAARLL